MSATEFGEWLQGEFDRRRLNAAQFGREIGWSDAAVRHWLKGTRSPSERACVQIAQAFDMPLNDVRRIAGLPVTSAAQGQTATTTATVTPGPSERGNEVLLTGGQSPIQDVLVELEHLKARVAEIGGTAWIRAIGRVPADAVRWAEWEHEERTMPVPVEWLGSRSEGEHFILEVSGDCLAQRRIYSGMHVLCRRLNGESPADDQIVVVRIGQEYTLKIWSMREGRPFLIDGDGNVIADLATLHDVSVLGVVTTFWGTP